MIRSIPASSGALALVLLAACAQTPEPLYGWGSYQSQLYLRLKGGAAPDAQIKELEDNEQRILGRGHALPPGYRAHLAMLYGETGQMDKARTLLLQEKSAFPESAAFVDYLLAQMR